MKQINRILKPYFYGKLDVEERICAEQLDAHFTSQLQGLRDAVLKTSEDGPGMIYKSDVLSLLDTLMKREER